MKRFGVSLVVAAIISSIIFLILNDFGITWDEPIHIRNADRYVAWLKQPYFGDKDKFFAADSEDVHPPFRKLVAGLTHELLTNNLKVIDNTRGYRISSLFFVLPLIFLLTYVAIGLFGYGVGIVVPFMFSFLPHILFLTPLVTMDYAVAALWFIAVVTGLKGAEDYFFLTVSGICVGLTMLTKLHGFLLFVPVGGYLVWRKQYVKLGVLVFIAFAIYIGGWPWLWTHTFTHIQEYFHIQTAHGSIPEFIFGKTYTFAPWWYPIIMFMTTTPALILILFAIGTFNTDSIILFNALYPILFFTLPGVYRYDWIRLFLPAFPFVCLVVGYGIQKFKRIFAPFIIIVWFITLYFSVIRIHPWESAYYNEFVGSIAGAYKLGMETEFWGNSYLGVLPWMNANKMHLMCVTPTTHPFYYYQAMGQIESGVTFTADRNSCDYVVVLMRQGLFIRDPYIAKIVGTQKPIYTVSVDGVSLVRVYDITKMKQ